jgi:hypothetical protein
MLKLKIRKECDEEFEKGRGVYEVPSFPFHQCYSFHHQTAGFSALDFFHKSNLH